MPQFLEKKLKKRYGAKSDVPYKIMNAKGFMRGSKETAKGKAAEKKHEKRGSYEPSVKLRGLGGEQSKKKKKKSKGPSFMEALR